MSNYINPSGGSYNSKGDFIAGSSDNLVKTLNIGADGKVLTADDTTLTGLQWTTISSTLTCAFLSTKDDGAQSGTGSAQYRVINFTTEIFDVGGDFDGTDTFTAPENGYYVFISSVAFGTIPANCTRSEFGYQLNSGTWNYISGFEFDPAYVKTNENNMTSNMQVVVELDAGDTFCVRGMGQFDDQNVTFPGDVERSFYAGYKL